MSPPVVEIVGLEVFAHHGVHAHERRNGQTFLFDVRLECSSAVAEQSDDLVAGYPVEAVTVTVHKPQAPIPHPFADVTVTVRRP